MTANPIISYEFFPPGDDAGAERLTQVRQQLQPLQPEFISVTYGAGGSTQERTRQAVLDIHRAGVAVAPHLTCVGASEESLSALLDHYRESKINRIVALRGDSPPGAGPAYSGSLRYASDLVAFIRRLFPS